VTDTDKTQEQLIQELETLRAQVAELEQVEAERQRVEEALRAAEAKFRIVADNTYDWEFWINPQSQFIYSSPSCEKITGHAAFEFEAEPDLLARIIHPDDLPRYFAHTRDAMDQRSPCQLTFRIIRPDGDERWVEQFCQPVFDSEGRYLGSRGSNRDITERKRVEEVLRQSNAELEVRNQELDAFAHTVAHDLKNPIGLIVGYAETLIEDRSAMSDDERQLLLQVIARTGHKMNNIIEELLLLAQVRKTPVERMPLDMASIVAEALQRLADLVKRSQAEINLPASWPVALGYAPWIEEVWANYISNACKYGGHPLRIELGATVQEDGRVRFWVHDDGAGLTPEEQSRLFTPFTRLDQVRAKGQGLGLSIVRRIIEKMDGQVGVESTGRPGHGSTFSFTLPANHPAPA
jgi:PAS domain S-box-containing protein